MMALDNIRQNVTCNNSWTSWFIDFAPIPGSLDGTNDELREELADLLEVL